MKKKLYQQPTMSIVRLQQQNIICSSPYSMSAEGGRSQLTNGTDDLGWGSGSVRASGNTSVWDDDWSKQ